jgi:hypothetical protein
MKTISSIHQMNMNKRELISVKKSFALIIIWLFLAPSIGNCQCALNIQDVANVDCGNWCWLFTEKNLANYYGYSLPSNMEIAEWARSNGHLDLDDSITSCDLFPGACCVGSHCATCVINNWGDIRTEATTTLNSTILYNSFCYNKPVIFKVSGHVFLGCGILDGVAVKIFDGSLGTTIRPINDLYPNKPIIRLYFMKHSPNWSNHNYVTGKFNYSKCFSSANIITTDAKLEKIPSHSAQSFTFNAQNTIVLTNNFQVGVGCDVTFSTNSYGCP